MISYGRIGNLITSCGQKYRSIRGKEGVACRQLAQATSISRLRKMPTRAPHSRLNPVSIRGVSCAHVSVVNGEAYREQITNDADRISNASRWVAGEALAREPASTGGCGSYSIISWLPAASRLTLKSSTSCNPRLILLTPGGGDDLL